jgi:Na+/proline symporter
MLKPNYLVFRGVVLSPAVIPIALTVSWSKLTEAGVLCGAIGGACLGMLAWMIGCWKITGTVFTHAMHFTLIDFRSNQYFQPGGTIFSLV